MSESRHVHGWQFTVYGIAFASLHLLAAIIGHSGAQTMWEPAQPFYSWLIVTTSATTAVLKVGKRKYDSEDKRSSSPNPLDDVG